jgi:hypothetical protein
LNRQRKQNLSIVLVIVLLLSFILTGCIQDTFSREEPPPLSGEPDDGDPGLSAEEERRLAEEQKLEERRLLEESRREKLGEFYVPLPTGEQKENPPVKAKGIYVTGNSAGLENRFSGLLELLETTELNAMVIDVKNDHGLMSYKSEIEIVEKIGANKNAPVKDIDALMETLRERDVYPIARIVVFRDPYLPEQRPEWAIQRKDGGGSWRDMKRYAWVNPYEKNVWDYNIAIAKEAALKGFREIQFDYVRFPENAHRVDREARFPGSDDMKKDEAIQQFLTYARAELADYNVHISADVFGVIATSWGDSDSIGQTWEKVSPLVEVICPMIYPSHYGPGYFGFSVPDANPSGTIYRALEDAITRNAALENPAVIRPWLQSFTATWIKGYIPYGPREVRAQIDAARSLGVDEYLIWNASNRYFASSFLPAEDARRREDAKAAEKESKGLDVLGRTPEQALEAFMEAFRRKNWRQAFAWHSTGFTLNELTYRPWFEGLNGSLRSYKNVLETKSAGESVFTVNVEIVHGKDTVTLEGQLFQVIKENSVWRVKPSAAFMDELAKSDAQE